MFKYKILLSIQLMSAGDTGGTVYQSINEQETDTGGTGGDNIELDNRSDTGSEIYLEPRTNSEYDEIDRELARLAEDIRLIFN